MKMIKENYDGAFEPVFLMKDVEVIGNVYDNPELMSKYGKE